MGGEVRWVCILAVPSLRYCGTSAQVAAGSLWLELVYGIGVQVQGWGL